MKKFLAVVLAAFGSAAFIYGCGGAGKTAPAHTFRIISGSENKSLEPLIQDFAKHNGIAITMDYKGSVDIMTGLSSDDFPYDAVWPAQSLWVKLGDNKGRVKHLESIMTSPVVFGLRKSLAQKLGFVGRDVEVRELLAAIQNGDLRFGMTSATQSNSGAMAYLGFLNALSGNPDVLSRQNLQDPKVVDGIRSLLSGVNRSSGSSEWLEEAFLKSDLTAMVNYEALIIEANKQLVAKGQEPLYAIYPKDGVGIADSPLGFVDQGFPGKDQEFEKLKAYLKSDEVQKKLLDLGRRTGFGGSVASPPVNSFNPDWGIDGKRVISPIRVPSADVVLEALRLYQTEFRKPSLTVFCLDYSGSMEGTRSQSLKRAMRTLLDPAEAQKYLLQPSSQDIVVVLPFNDQIMDTWTARGSEPASLTELLARIESLTPEGGTDIYSPAMKALAMINAQPDLEKYIPSVVLMTDGESNTGATFRDLEANWRGQQAEWNRREMSVPIYTIAFGEASQDQLAAIANLTGARVFDGSKDLIDAFKKVRGYN